MKGSGTHPSHHCPIFICAVFQETSTSSQRECKSLSSLHFLVKWQPVSCWSSWFHTVPLIWLSAVPLICLRIHKRIPGQGGDWNCKQGCLHWMVCNFTSSCFSDLVKAFTLIMKTLKIKVLNYKIGCIHHAGRERERERENKRLHAGIHWKYMPLLFFLPWIQKEFKYLLCMKPQKWVARLCLKDIMETNMSLELKLSIWAQLRWPV